MNIEPWTAWTFAITVGLSVLAAGWTARVRPEPRPTLPLMHVAGAALVGVIGWEALHMLPGTITGLFLATAGIPEPRGAEEAQAFAAASVLFVVASALAIVGILRRRPWGIVLGIGVAVARVAVGISVLFQWLALSGNVVGDDNYLPTALSIIGMSLVPPVVAIALLAWPLLSRSEAASVPPGAGAWTPTPPEPEAGR
jgi:hypothetical protein